MYLGTIQNLKIISYNIGKNIRKYILLENNRTPSLNEDVNILFVVMEVGKLQKYKLKNWICDAMCWPVPSSVVGRQANKKVGAKIQT